MRTTRKDMENSFIALAGALGRKVAIDHKDIGAWEIDYNPAYGGARIEEIVNEHGATINITNRMPPVEFCGHCSFTLQMLQQKNIFQILQHRK